MYLWATVTSRHQRINFFASMWPVCQNEWRCTDIWHLSNKPAI